MQLVDRIVAPWRRPAGGAAPGLAGAAPSIASFVFIVLIAAQLAALLWRVLGSPGSDAAPEITAAEPSQPVVDVAAIVNAHLFGVAPSSSDPSAAPLTSANLTLAGTLAGPQPEQGWAIIGASGQSARVYATGSTLPGGAKLFAVYPDRVILDRGGSRESLLLPRLSSAAGGGPMPMAGAVRAPTSGASLADSVRQLLAENPSAANDLLRPQPVFAGGTLKGYRVYPGRNRARFASFGLQPGDLVMAVNGAPLDDPNRGLEILRGIGQGSAVTLTVDRGGQQQQITVDPIAIAPEQLEPEDDMESDDSAEPVE